MTAISKDWVSIADASVDPDSPLDTTLMTCIRDDLVHLREWIGAAYTAGAVQNHNHDGSNSEIIEIGSNALRNGSFETGLTGWAAANYTGGSNAVQTSGASHGKKCWAATSTVLANGGAAAKSQEFISIAAGDVVNVSAKLHASTANVSSNIQIIWYDSADAQISISNAIYNTNTPTTSTLVSGSEVAPATARSYKINLVGGIPTIGSAVGTVYFDGVFARTGLSLPSGAGTLYLPITRIVSNATVTTVFETLGTTFVEAFNARILVSGTYRTAWNQYTSAIGMPSYARVYKNGSAYGTQRSGNVASYTAQTTEDLEFKAGDTVQIFVGAYDAPRYGGVSIFRLGISAMNVMPSIPYLQSIVIGER